MHKSRLGSRNLSSPPGMRRPRWCHVGLLLGFPAMICPPPFVSSFVFLNLFPLLLLYASTKGTLNPLQDEVNIKINRYINLALVLYGFSLYFLFLISLWNPTSLSGERNPSPINASDWRCVPLPCLGDYWAPSPAQHGPCTGNLSKASRAPALSSVLPSPDALPS